MASLCKQYRHTGPLSLAATFKHTIVLNKQAVLMFVSSAVEEIFESLSLNHIYNTAYCINDYHLYYYNSLFQISKCYNGSNQLTTLRNVKP